MKKAFVTFKDKLTEIFKANPVAFILLIIFFVIWISFSLTYTMKIKYENSKLFFELKKRELKTNDLTGK